MSPSKCEKSELLNLSIGLSIIIYLKIIFIYLYKWCLKMLERPVYSISNPYIQTKRSLTIIVPK